MNPCLAGALALAAGLDGVRNKIDPGKAQEDNLYELGEEERAARSIEFLPRDLQEAIDAFAADQFVVEALGQELRDEFITYKRREWNEYHQTISDWEIERYSHLFWAGATGERYGSRGFSITVERPLCIRPDLSGVVRRLPSPFALATVIDR